MVRVFCIVVTQVVVLGCCVASIYLLGPVALKFLGISEYARGLDLFFLCLVGLGCVILGSLVGLFAFPLILWPVVSPTVFWHWAASARSVKIPLLSALHDLWCRFLYRRHGG